ncbi:MAG TPA: serine hydrolase domain-containing protein [Polyangiaceae bacterium]
MTRSSLLLFALLAACSSSSGSASPPAPDGGASDTGAPDVAMDDDGGASDDATSDSPTDDAADAADAASLDPPIPAAFQAFAQAFDDERVQLGAPGAAVAILENGQLAFFHGFGLKGPSSTQPVDARTLFRIGSMTKSLTATALLGLVDDGKVGLDATLTSIVPNVGLPAGTDTSALTVRELLTHQSGLYDYLAVSGPTQDSALASVLESASFAADEYYMDPPGTFWNYANPNYYLAGLVLETAGGTLYRDAVKQRVLSPLGMTRTFFLPSEVDADGDFTNGKSTGADGGAWDVAPDSYDNAWARPAGYAFTSVLDYAKFVQFLLAGDPAVLSDTQRTAMQSIQVNTDTYGSVEGYGFALIVDQGFNVGTSYYPTKLVSHGGDIPGYASDFYLVPATGFAMIAFANADGVHFQSSVALALQRFAGLPAPGTPPTGVAVDTSLFPLYAGSYDDPNNVGAVTVTANGGTLTISMPALDAANISYVPTLQPADRDNFVLTIEGQALEVTFVPDATGTYAWLRTRVFVAQRTAVDGGPEGG